MNLASQVTSLKLSKRLRELSVKQKSYFWWVNPSLEGLRAGLKPLIYPWNVKPTYPDKNNIYSAFTASELLELLPDSVSLWKNTSGNKNYFCEINSIIKIRNVEIENTASDALAKMLIHLIEQKLIET